MLYLFLKCVCLIVTSAHFSYVFICGIRVHNAACAHELSIVLVLQHRLNILHGQPVASALLPVSACSPFFPVLEKPSQTAVAKGGCVCGHTHLSPADGSFPGHTVPPARLPSRAWPSPQPAQQATSITSPCWRNPFYGLSVHNASSNAGQYPAFPWPLQSILSIPVSDISVAICAGCSFLSSVEYQIWVGSSQIQSWWNETELSDGVEMVSWPGIFFVMSPSIKMNKATCFPSVWCREMSISVAIKRFQMKRRCAVIGFSHQFLQEFLTNSGVKLLHPRHPSLQPPNRDTTNCAHPLVCRQA